MELSLPKITSKDFDFIPNGMEVLPKSDIDNTKEQSIFNK